MLVVAMAKVKTRNFGGKRYSRFPIPEPSKAKAQASAKKLRARGMNVRVRNESGGYYLYGRRP